MIRPSSNQANQSQPMSEFDAAVLLVSQMFTQSKTDMTELEANLWAVEVGRLGLARLTAFAEFWMGGDAGVTRAPRVQDFRRYADPNHLNEALAFDRLRQMVEQVGPYVDPPSEDARLHATIIALGGWVKVCQEYPDINDDFKIKRYKERFSNAWTDAQAKAVQGVLAPSTRALGLCSSPAQLRVAFNEPADDVLLAPPQG